MLALSRHHLANSLKRPLKSTISKGHSYFLPCSSLSRLSIKSTFSFLNSSSTFSTTASSTAAVVSTTASSTTTSLGYECCSVNWNDSQMKFYTGKVGTLASGSVFCQAGDSVVFTSVVAEPTAVEGNDFLPLTVEYRQKSYATGMIPKSLSGRDMMNDEDILHSRLIDRCIRPLFPVGFFNDTQIISTVHANDGMYHPSVIAVNSASMALCLSDIPWDGPIGCVRVGYIHDQLVLNPTMEQMKLSTLDLVYAANSTRTLMIEVEAQEFPEDKLGEALVFAHDGVQPILQSQMEFLEKNPLMKKKKKEFDLAIPPENMKQFALAHGYDEALELYTQHGSDKGERQLREKQLMGKLMGLIATEFASSKPLLGAIAAHDVLHKAFRDRILYGEDQLRCDNRSMTDLRKIGIDVDVLPVVHGSSFFSRGDTQSLCTVTLGKMDNHTMSLLTETSSSEHKEFKLHYEFPPYCVNETGRLGGINRRMIGHGALAEKALKAVVPTFDAFGFNVRVTSEVTGSDGSSSMATTCGGSMALMDAGVPITRPVAGISIGLITEGDPYDGKKEIKNYKLLTDILGTEDHYGDMDFKVAGTEQGVTAVQLDVKLPGIPLDLLIEGIHQSYQVRLNLIKQMKKTLSKPRPKQKDRAPHAEQMTVDVSMIRNLIGMDGENLKSIEEESGCSVTVKPTGTVHIFAPSKERLNTAKELVGRLTLEFTEGEIYQGTVIKLLDFGAIVAVAPGRHGVLHISEVEHQNGETIADVVALDQVLKVKCIGTADRYAKLSIKKLPKSLRSEFRRKHVD